MAHDLNTDSHGAPSGSRVRWGSWLGWALLIAVLLGGFSWWASSKSWAQIRDLLINVALLTGGLTLVIFIHELGHFLAAKWCDVHVETFSIGFGPAIPGLSFRRGETLYKFAWIPLGGYVKMLGENPYEQDEDATRDDPRAYHNKSVGQRMVIISAGVVMNLLLGSACFIYAYMAGKIEVLPLVGYVEPGSPADQAGLTPGSRILQINGNTRPAFEDLMYASATARADITKIYLRWETPQGDIREANLSPRKLPQDQRPLLGLGPMSGLALASIDLAGQGPVYPGTPAAGKGLQLGEVVLAIKNLADDQQVEPLIRLEEYRSGDREARVKALRKSAQILYQWRSQPIALQLAHPDRGDSRWVELPPNPVRWFGLKLRLGPIVSKNPTTKSVAVGKELEVGDVITAVDGQPIDDPFRLPELLETRAGKIVRLTVRRGDQEVHLGVQPAKSVPSWWEYAPSRPLAPWPIPALGITCRVEPELAADLDPKLASVTDPETGQPVPLPRGTACLSIELRESSPRQPQSYRTVAYRFDYDETASDTVAWPYIFWVLQGPLVDPEVFLTVRTPDGNERRVRLRAQSMPDWFNPDRGLIRDREKVLYYASGPFQALLLGLRDTHRTVVNIYLTLKNLFTGDISVRLLSGPAGIVSMGYEMVSLGFDYFVWFLGLISINLAVINFLPIPILDGGHMVFLVVEKIRGKPVSRRVLEYANIVGLLVLLAVVIIATTMDFHRFFDR